MKKQQGKGVLQNIIKLNNNNNISEEKIQKKFIYINDKGIIWEKNIFSGDFL